MSDMNDYVKLGGSTLPTPEKEGYWKQGLHSALQKHRIIKVAEPDQILHLF